MAEVHAMLRCTPVHFVLNAWPRTSQGCNPKIAIASSNHARTNYICNVEDTVSGVHERDDNDRKENEDEGRTRALTYEEDHAKMWVQVEG